MYTMVNRTYFDSKELVGGTRWPMQNTKPTPRNKMSQVIAKKFIIKRIIKSIETI